MAQPGQQHRWWDGRWDGWYQRPSGLWQHRGYEWRGHGWSRGGPHGTPVKLSMTGMRRERTLSGKRHRTNGVVRQVMKMGAMMTDLECSTMRSRVRTKLLQTQRKKAIGEQASTTSAWSEHLRGNAIASRGWANLRTSCNGKGAAREIL